MTGRQAVGDGAASGSDIRADLPVDVDGEAELWWSLYQQAQLDDRAAVLALPPVARAYYVTWVFEREVADVGLFGFFSDFEGLDWFFDQVLEGYQTFGLHEQRTVIERVILPIASSTREVSLRRRYRQEPTPVLVRRSRLRRLDGLVDDHADVRLAAKRQQPDAFVGPRTEPDGPRRGGAEPPALDEARD